MNSSAIWEIIALGHVLEGRVIARGEAEWNYMGVFYRDKITIQGESERNELTPCNNYT